MSKTQPEVSDEAVKMATNRDWKGWVEFLDSRGAQKLSHKEIVALVGVEGGVESGWWQQMVTVGYEKLKGRRATGETQDGLFQIGVQRTLPLDYRRAWAILLSPEGVQAWLGEGARLEFTEGEQYHLKDGAEGEVRVIHPDQYLRITWQPTDWERHSTIQVRVIPKDDRVTVSFHQEQLPGKNEREARRAHFKRALAEIERLAAER